MLLSRIADLDRYPLSQETFNARCKKQLDQQGALVLEHFLLPDAIKSIESDGDAQQALAFYTKSSHNIYLRPSNPDFPANHPRNRQVASSKGCITTDQIPADSALHTLYNSSRFRHFLCHVLGESALYEYADPLSSINLHYAARHQELGWHYDNSSFAITLMIRPADLGGRFEYVRNVRDADRGEMNYARSEAVLNGEVTPQTLNMEAGTLVLFRGRDAMHRVTPVQGDTTRMLVVLAYNTEPDVALSESARMTFFGRLN